MTGALSTDKGTKENGGKNNNLESKSCFSGF